MKVVIVTGARTRNDATTVFSALGKENPDVVVQGGAVGIDSLAEIWARRRGVPVITVDIAIEETGSDRNVRMIDFAREIFAASELKVCAFPGNGPGTFHCINVARARRLEVETF